MSEDATLEVASGAERQGCVQNPDLLTREYCIGYIVLLRTGRIRPRGMSEQYINDSIAY